MVPKIYKCLNCEAIYGTSFQSDGLGCPYCDGPTVPMGKAFNRQEYFKIVDERKFKMPTVPETKREQPGAPTIQNKGFNLSVDLLGLDAVKKVYAIANNAIYFNDSSDYLTALHGICKTLNPKAKKIGSEYIDEE